MNNIKKSLKTSNGITLIALVITIIVLLILAGISISMLSGDNGILQKVTDAKTNTEKATVVELAKTDVLGQIAENKGEALTETQLKTILSKYFEEFDDELPEDLSETNINLTAKEAYGGYTNIALADIYNGKISNVVSHTYHLSSPNGTESSGTPVVNLYDENDNIVPIIEAYSVQISPSATWNLSDGAILIYRTSGPPKEYLVTLTINGQEVSETIVVFPYG